MRFIVIYRAVIVRTVRIKIAVDLAQAKPKNRELGTRVIIPEIPTNIIILVA